MALSSAQDIKRVSSTAVDLLLYYKRKGSGYLGNYLFISYQVKTENTLECLQAVFPNQNSQCENYQNSQLKTFLGGKCWALQSSHIWKGARLGKDTFGHAWRHFLASLTNVNSRPIINTVASMETLTTTNHFAKPEWFVATYVVSNTPNRQQRSHFSRFPKTALLCI